LAPSKPEPNDKVDASRSHLRLEKD